MTSADAVIANCRANGFALAGVCAAEPTSYAEALRAWLREGRHGEMTWLEEHVELRIDPAQMMAGVRSIICVADRYHDGAPDPETSATQGRIARYARGEDYHRTIKRRLHALCDTLSTLYPDETFRACVDTAPVLEREHAQRAGLGAVGKNTLIIDRSVGSYLLLGEILTTLDIAPSAPASPDPCGTCQRCIDACPTDAITPFSVDATRCISYLTIEHRSVIDADLHPNVRDWLFGCDVCQEVCPHTQPTVRAREQTVHEAFMPRRISLDVLDVLRWTEDDRREAFLTSALKRAKLPMMKRNALIVGANRFRTMTADERAQFQERVERILVDVTEDELVRATARQIINRLDSEPDHHPASESPSS